MSNDQHEKRNTDIISKTPETVETFDLFLKTWPFKGRDKEGGIVSYYVTQMTGDERAEYVNFLTSCFEKDEETGEPIKGSFNSKDADLKLLEKSVRYAAGDEPVPLETLKAWPGLATSSLATRSRIMNGLDKKAVETAKKD